MLERILRLAAIVISLVVVVSWGLFVIDETREASKLSAAETAGRQAGREADPTPDEERDRERAHTTVREAIDDVNDVLVAPFAPLVDDASSQWLRRTAPAVLALLVFGFGFGLLSRYAREHA